jgi:uncharacterized membrane protein YfcA
MEWGNLWLLVVIALVSFALSFLGAAVGLVLGHLRLPLLIAYLGNPAAGAACNLIVSGTGALAGSFRHVREGRVSWHCLALMGLPSAAGAVLGVELFSRQISHFWAYLVLGVVLVVSGLQMTRPSAAGRKAPELPRLARFAIEVGIGLGLGALASVTGLMLGSLRLPMMMRFLKLGPKVAVGSNMAIGCLTALVGTTWWFWTGLSRGKLEADAGSRFFWPELTALLVVVPPTMLGGYLGGWLTGRVRQETVKALAGWIVAATGVLLVGQGGWPTAKQFFQRPPLEVPGLTEPYESFEDWDVEDDG